VDAGPDYLDRSGRPRLAYRHVAGTGPTIVFLPGYMSDMAGGKATALFDWAAAEGHACLLLDYAGCGLSDGLFADQTLLDWRGDGPGRVAGLVGIAAAPDFTDWGFCDAEKAIILAEGQLREETPYSDQPYVTTREFFQSGEANRLLGGPIPLAAPVRLLHGEEDGDVPPEISLRLSAALVSEDVQVTLVKGGDHRLSRDGDIALLIDTVARLATAN